MPLQLLRSKATPFLSVSQSIPICCLMSHCLALLNTCAGAQSAGLGLACAVCTRTCKAHQLISCQMRPLASHPTHRLGASPSSQHKAEQTHYLTWNPEWKKAPLPLPIPHLHIHSCAMHPGPAPRHPAGETLPAPVPRPLLREEGPQLSPRAWEAS